MAEHAPIVSSDSRFCRNYHPHVLESVGGGFVVTPVYFLGLLQRTERSHWKLLVKNIYFLDDR